jgi:hypothetical protein
MTKGLRLVCQEAFGLFEVGDTFYCFAVEQEYFVVWSSRPIIGQNEFKISKNHRSKFRPF